MPKNITVIPEDKLQVMKDIFPESRLRPYQGVKISELSEPSDWLGKKLPYVPDACITAVYLSEGNPESDVSGIHLLMPNDEPAH